MPAIAQDVGLDLISGCNRERRGSTRRRRAKVAVPAKYRNRPSSIRVAIYRVWERSADHGFTRATTAVLQAILAAGVRASDPFEPVFAKKATLAKLAGCSEVSVYRAMRKLEEDGWIRRAAQARMEDGLLDIGLITITNKLAIVVGLVSDDSGQQSPSKEQNHTSENFSDSDQSFPPPVGTAASLSGGAVGEDFSPAPTAVETPAISLVQRRNTSSPGSMKDGLKDGPIYTHEHMVYPKASVHTSPRASEFVRMDGRSVAQELVWLITEGRLTYGQLFELQTLAKQAPGGQRLSDYVALRSHRLTQLSTTNDCYRYLKNLISQQLDARYLCAQRSKSEHRVYRRKQRTEAAESRNHWIRARHGCVFVDTTSGRTYEVNANHGLLNVGTEGRPSNEPCLKITSRFIQAVESGKLVRFVPKSDRSSREESVSHIAAALQILKRRLRPIQQTSEG